ncbi:MAG: biotin--[acetyl-CoA-carboxylase] ligase [Rickettsiales bacterium]|nr:biotin--[acetyl-CoA-carboxylase] ligase [Rickettsiales bacterium]|tara:strand:- start:2762 stop:3484 length:723 start_codon:yes stop_codon:yes gene_type:complete
MYNSNFDHFFYKSLKNTNDTTKKIYDFKKSTNIALLALKQKIGRGRTGKKWISKKGDLTCSFLFNFQTTVSRLGQINLWFINKIFIVLKKFNPDLDLKIKWPNDLYLNEKKLGGILVETSILKGKVNYFLFGVGINLVSNPKNLCYPTISLGNLSKTITPLKLFLEISKILSSNYYELKNSSMLKIDNDFLKNFKDFKRVVKIKFKEKILEGKFSSITKNGELVLTTSKEKLIINFGQIL